MYWGSHNALYSQPLGEFLVLGRQLWYRILLLDLREKLRKTVCSLSAWAMNDMACGRLTPLYDVPSELLHMHIQLSGSLPRDLIELPLLFDPLLIHVQS